uniref:NADH-ubiquinone oxidoreductase chain 2 n=1 Tax=Scarabaeidae sp. BMNH 1274750 TaxID=1796539 RepID=A0A126TGM1_9SCAR|nr:NADH dehydrogenase subunit 2 [Scarabaeidae sp. BMNH 1274750]
MFFMYKLLFSFSLMIGTLISISAYSWMNMWLGLEINLLSIIPLISNSNNLMASEASLKYFITQALASTLLLFSIIMMSMNLMYNIDMNFYLLLILNTALLTKMGAAPFHFWFPEIIEGLNWINSMIMLTWQKIAPMILIMYTNLTLFYSSIIIIISSIISGIMGMNQVSMRKILTYSSINHIAWMLASMMFIETIWSYYFLIYTIITMNIIIIFKYFNIFYLKQLFSSMNNYPMIKFFFVLNFMSLSGLPPFLGFFPKWLTIQTLIQNNYYFITYILIIFTLITLYFYMRITLCTLTLTMNELSFNNKTLFNLNYIYLTNFITIMGLIFMTILFNFN